MHIVLVFEFFTEILFAKFYTMLVFRNPSSYKDCKFVKFIYHLEHDHPFCAARILNMFAKVMFMMSLENFS